MNFYQDFPFWQDSRRDPGEEFFPWRDPGKYRFLSGILAEIRGGNFSRKGSRRENWPPWRDPSGIPVPTHVKNAVRMRVFPASGAYLPLKLYAITKQTTFRRRN